MPVLNHTKTAGRSGADVHGPIQPPRYGGGGRGQDPNAPGYYERRRRYRMAVALGLLSVITIFVVLTVAFVFLQRQTHWDPRLHAYYRHWLPLPLPVGLLWTNTILLLASSCTLELARRTLMHRAVTAPLADIPGVAPAADHSLPWLGATVLLGSGFLAGQLAAWQRVRDAGFHLTTAFSSSFFYVLTAAHGLHLTGGILVLLYATVTAAFSRALIRRRLVVDAAAWYWHAMAGLWLYLFALLYFAK
jgi:cytochrome c oxidase subunit 3